MEASLLLYLTYKMKKNLLIVLTGLSGSGKTTLCLRFLEKFKQASRVITTTTRALRPQEVDGKDYFFETKENFLKRIEQDEFLEYANVYNNYYGISKEAVINSAYADKDLIICLDVQGAQSLKAKIKSYQMARRLVTIFVSTASLKELEHRLIMRGTDDVSTIQKRLQMAEKELRTLQHFDYHLCSQDRDHDWQCLQHIYFAEKMRI